VTAGSAPASAGNGDALVLSGSIGRGHDVVAEVCASALRAMGLQPTVHDCMALLGPVNSAVAEAVYRFMLARPGIYDGFHFAHLRAEGAFSRYGDRAACRRLAHRLDEELANDRLRLVLSVFATGAAAGAELASRRPGLRTAVFCTDATVHAMWVHDRTDLFIASSELTSHTVRRYRPSAEIAVIPAPVRPGFYTPPPKLDARARLGVRPDSSCVLLMAGGWGIGPLARSAAELAGHGHEVLAVAGSNRRLLRELHATARAQPLVHPFGYTDEMPSMMSAADVVVTGPGQACHEVRVVGRPLVLLDTVPGHGRENLLYELMLGGASSCSPSGESVCQAVEATLKSGLTPPPWPVRSESDWRARFVKALEPLGITVPPPSP
jgi:processive 1,2-diacylglycerol beta-glucosyltransferase